MPDKESHSPVVRLLARLFRQMHWIAGITAAKEGTNERKFVFIWLGVIGFVLVWCAFVFYLMVRVF